ncbi:formylglycine-generating enzyme family protein [Magnetospirillum molischianum]|uniref:Sulfatase-modifying factor enzyme-like domain-containing protein n=1 Tax=Magnetospirillum molischianum DSM 120 TaxID=1150626 RepID=H8FS14_MAGML|nr:formylglycine-generating enzyme family protein [Magnetospirillum molischianum]CCG41152.1 conserved exported hypothetical protein [Magnetospirillum molischianum DSM 120]
MVAIRRLVGVLMLSLAGGGPVCAADTFSDCTDCPILVVIPAGTARIGSPPGEPGRETFEEPRHTVTIAKPFALGRTPVTQAEWQAVMGSNPSRFKNDTRPVESVSWIEVQTFLHRLNEKTGQHYRLPTETEWEYAARAGGDTRYPWGDEIGVGKAACVGCGSRWDGEQTAPVGSFPPNRFGLFDMAGNVWQWTQDCWSANYQGAPADGSARTGPETCSRVIRGGSWGNSPAHLRCAKRMRFASDFRFIDIGVRIARDLD